MSSVESSLLGPESLVGQSMAILGMSWGQDQAIFSKSKPSCIIVLKQATRCTFQKTLKEGLTYPRGTSPNLQKGSAL